MHYLTINNTEQFWCAHNINIFYKSYYKQLYNENSWYDWENIEIKTKPYNLNKEQPENHTATKVLLC